MRFSSPPEEPHLGEVVAGRVHGNRLARGEAQQVDDLQPFEADGLLEGEGDAHARPLGDALFGDVLAV